MLIEDEKELEFLYKINRAWPEMWKWIQIQANKDYPLEEVIFVLKTYWSQKEIITSPWAYCTISLQKKIKRREDREREGKWIQVKQEDADFAKRLAELIKGIGRKI